ncbi:MAG: hypothetical protein ACRD1T_17745, partial [Acidimicrobiia bacterium]
AGRLEVLPISQWAGALCRVNHNLHGAGSPGVSGVPWMPRTFPPGRKDTRWRGPSVVQQRAFTGRTR